MSKDSFPAHKGPSDTHRDGVSSVSPSDRDGGAEDRVVEVAVTLEEGSAVLICFGRQGEADYHTPTEN